MTMERPQTLYLTRNGLMEPLGQSQVLAYLRGLSTGYRITLITFEKPEDLADTDGMQALRRECERLDIHWLPQRFHYRPRFVAPLADMVRFGWLGLRAVRGGARLVHARSYMPAAVALLLNRLTGVPFVFDMRALWPEELITAGRLRRGSLMHRAIVWAERRCLARGEVVSLTQAAAVYLRERYPQELAGKTVHVIPTCADVDRFRMTAADDGPIRFGCIGTVLSGWFRLDWLATFYRVAARRDAKARLEVITRDDHATVGNALAAAGVPIDRVEIYGAAPARMPQIVRRQTASVMFFTGGLSKLGSSPTRMGEVLACGRPVVANAGVGDVARIIEEHRVGVLVEDGDDRSMHTALDALDALLADPDLAGRCRRAAEAVFALEAGTRAYHEIYRRLAPPLAQRTEALAEGAE